LSNKIKYTSMQVSLIQKEQQKCDSWWLVLSLEHVLRVEMHRYQYPGPILGLRTPKTSPIEPPNATKRKVKEKMNPKRVEHLHGNSYYMIDNIVFYLSLLLK
jgi:hypothetical protein